MPIVYLDIEFGEVDETKDRPDVSQIHNYLYFVSGDNELYIEHSKLKPLYLEVAMVTEEQFSSVKEGLLKTIQDTLPINLSENMDSIRKQINSSEFYNEHEKSELIDLINPNSRENPEIIGINADLIARINSFYEKPMGDIVHLFLTMLNDGYNSSKVFTKIREDLTVSDKAGLAEILEGEHVEGKSIRIDKLVELRMLIISFLTKSAFLKEIDDFTSNTKNFIIVFHDIFNYLLELLDTRYRHYILTSLTIGRCTAVKTDLLNKLFKNTKFNLDVKGIFSGEDYSCAKQTVIEIINKYTFISENIDISKLIYKNVDDASYLVGGNKNYKSKYLKYKIKYLKLKNQLN